MKESHVNKTKFNFWIWRNLPDCQEMVKVIGSSLDKKLSWSEWIVMKLHLRSCDPCVNFLKQIKFIREALLNNDEKLIHQDSHTKLSDDARNRLKDALKASSEAT